MPTPHLNAMERKLIRVERAAVLLLLAGALFLVGIGFLADGLWRWLASVYDPIIASIVIGGLMLVLSLICVIVHLAKPARSAKVKEEPKPAENPTTQLVEAFLMGLNAARNLRRP